METENENPEYSDTYLDYLEKLVDYLADGDLNLNENDDYELKRYFFEATRYAYFAHQTNCAAEEAEEKEAYKAVLAFYPSSEILGSN